MLVLAIESSAAAASAALFEDGRLLAECFADNGLIHSRTLMPLVERTLATGERKPDALSAVAVAQGPGSFTGLRIGMAGAVGMAEALGIPCIGISTLEGCARQLAVADGIICPVLDARRGYVYSALFRSKNGVMERIAEDGMVEIAALSQKIKEFSNNFVFLVGDGAVLCYNTISKYDFVRLAPAHLVMQRASGIGLAAVDRLSDPAFSPEPVKPVYLRMCQAERELCEKKKIRQKDE